MFQKMCLSIDDAKRIAAAARVEAEKNNWNVVIAIVDDGAHLMYLERMDGTQKASSVVAVEKAKTALLYKRPSVALENAIAGGRLAVLSMPLAVKIEGGLPIVHDGEFLGAIGISGVQSSEDGIIAKAGLAALVG
jgi:glc operon protein GlcG